MYAAPCAVSVLVGACDGALVGDLVGALDGPVGALVGAMVGATMVVVAVDIVETVADVPVAVEIADVRVLVVQLPEQPLMYHWYSSLSPAKSARVSVITKVTVAARLAVTDEPIEIPVAYEEHGKVHAPTATP